MSADVFPPFVHRAVFYTTPTELIDVMAVRVRERLDQGGPVLVAADSANEQALARRLVGVSERIEFVDSSRLLCGSAALTVERLIALARTATAHGPVSILLQHPERARYQDDEAFWLKLECGVNATLTDLPVDLSCLYSAQDRRVDGLDAARLTHPWLVEGDDERTNDDYRSPFELLVDTQPELAPDLGEPDDVHLFDPHDGPAFRGWLGDRAERAGLDADDADELLLAAHEVGMIGSSVNGRDQRVPIGFWRSSTHVTLDVGVAETLPGLWPNRLPDDHRLGALSLVDRASTVIRILVYRDTPNGSRIRVLAPVRHR